MSELTIALLYGSVRNERQGIGLAYFLEKQCRSRGWDTTLIDPRIHTLPLLEKTYKEYDTNDAPENMQYIAQVLDQADGFLIITAEYNHNIPPALSNILNHYGKEFQKKISGIITYSSGPFGGIRSEMPLRQMISKLGAPAIPTVFPVSQIHESFSEDGKALDLAYERRIQGFLDEFAWYTEAIKKARS